MNFTLKQILRIADDIHTKVFDKNNSIVISDYINSLHNLRAYIEQTKSITRRIEAIHNACLNKVQKDVDKEITTFSKDNLTTFSKDDDHPATRDSKDYKEISKKNKDSFTNIQASIVPGINTDVQIVKNINMIPNTNIYWVNGQFAIRINNVVIKGNVGNIYTRDGMNKIIKPQNVDKCIFGSKCKKYIEKKKCSHYHDPADFDLGKDDILNHNQFIRNYINSSWMYFPGSVNNKNKNTRHIGNRDSLCYDIDKISKCDKRLLDKEIDTRINQAMHDILILMALKDKNLL